MYLIEIVYKFPQSELAQFQYQYNAYVKVYIAAKLASHQQDILASRRRSYTSKFIILDGSLLTIREASQRG